jgi:hypothetical protein
MDSLEISTITILHTLSTLNKNELAFLGQIAQSALSSTSDKIDLPKAGELLFYDDQLQVLLKKFNVQSLNALRAILAEINFLSIFRNI